ncbi:MAG: alpha/beta fold hydrolase [Micropruina sp.]
MRELVTVAVDTARELAEPGRAVQFVVRLDDRQAPLEAMLVPPEPASGLVVYFPGFNTPLGPWEIAKCRMLAASFAEPVLLTEIPGMSRFGDSLPGKVRKRMLRGDIDAWAELMVDYQLAALDTLQQPLPTRIDLIGYSTGCSLAVAALRRWQEMAGVRSVTLIEPVATLPRNLLTLELHNLSDVLRQPASFATNHAHDWVMRARRRQVREPWVRYGPVDLVAIAQVLTQPHLPGDLPLDGSLIVNLVRGNRSDLCHRDSFRALHEAAPDAGLTIEVDGFGHPLWHSFPVLDVVVPLLGDTLR